MKIFSLVPFVFVGAILFVGAARLQTPESTSAPTTLTVIEHASTNALNDLGAKGDSVGDMITFANPVYDSTDKTRIGNDSGFCVRTFVGQVWQCSLTLALATPGGQITIEGAYYDTRDSELAITGGIDAYEGVRGQVTRHATTPDRSEYQLTFSFMQ